MNSKDKEKKRKVKEDVSTAPQTADRVPVGQLGVTHTEGPPSKTDGHCAVREG